MKSVSWQSVGNEIMPSGHEMLAALVAGEETGLRFDRFRLLDENETEIETTDAVSFEWSTLEDIDGAMVQGSTVVPGSSVTSDVHYIELLNNLGDAVARAELDDPIESGQAVLITRMDFFGNPDKLQDYDPNNNGDD